MPAAADPQGTRRNVSTIVKRHQPRQYNEEAKAWEKVPGSEWSPTFTGSSAKPKKCRDCGRRVRRRPHTHAPPRLPLAASHCTYA